MKSLMLIAIQVYWKLIPARKRPCCLFRESCSRHVYRIVQAEGWLPGLKAFMTRFRQCKTGYRFVYLMPGQHQALLADASMLKEENMSASLKKEMYQHFSQVEREKI